MHDFPLNRCFVLTLVVLLANIGVSTTQAGEDADIYADVREILDDENWSYKDIGFRAVTAYWDDDGTYVNIAKDEDRYYSSGQGIEVSLDPNFTDEIQQWLAPSENWTEPRFGLGFGIKQHIYTGIDITDPSSPAGDHPYGGYLYFAFSLQRSEEHKHDHFELDIGVIGERSQAGAVQRLIHDFFPDNDEPVAWGTQLANEMTGNFTFERTWKTRKGDLAGLEFDLLPAAGFDVGNVFIRARGRATLRIGKTLPDDFGPATLLGHRDHTARAFSDPQSDWSIYGYTTAGVDAVAHNIFLNAKTNANDSSLNLETLVAQVSVGIVARFHKVEFGWSQTWQSEEFETQVGGQTWGSWSLSYVCKF